MSVTELHSDALQAAAVAIPASTPIVMLNLLRYHPQATYGDTALALAPCSGREAYHQRYIPAFGQLTQGAGIQPVWVGTGLAHLVGPTAEQWDEIALVEYPSFKIFLQLVESAAYRTLAAPHRLAALADWRLLAMTKLS
jgi:hypothetical protein